MDFLLFNKTVKFWKSISFASGDWIYNLLDLYAFQSQHLLLAFYKIYGFFLRGNLSSHQFSIFVPISDVDTPEPDEKSIITYVSQLYDVFPDPPPGHPLFDAEAQRKFEQFKELASSLHMWIREHITIMQVDITQS